MPLDFPTDPFNQATPRPKSMADFFGSSYCFFVALTRVGLEAAIPRPSDTFMGGEIFPWHMPQNTAVAILKAGTNGPTSRIGISVSYRVDGRYGPASIDEVADQCGPVAIPGIGPIP